MRTQLAMLLFASFAVTQFVIPDAFPSPAFPLSDTAATFLITATWVSNMDDDEVGKPENIRCLANRQCQSVGTGIEVTVRGTILTAKHLFPNAEMADYVEVKAESGAEHATPFTITCVPVDSVDVAVCTPTNEPRPLPPPASVSFAAKAAETNQVWIRGFPGGAPLEGAGGFVTRVNSPFANTDALLVPGYSGGPAYIDGVVVGLVHDGLPVADVKSDPNVMGKGRVLLLAEIRQYLPASVIDEIEHPVAANASNQILGGSNSVLSSIFGGALGLGGLQNLSSGVGFASTSHSAAPAQVSPVASLTSPEILRSAYSIDTTNDEHALFSSTRKNYSTGVLKPNTGYRITAVQVDVISEMQATNQKTIVAPDGSSAEYTYTLTSDSIVSGKRGYLRARVIITETKL